MSPTKRRTRPKALAQAIRLGIEMQRNPETWIMVISTRLQVTEREFWALPDWENE